MSGRDGARVALRFVALVAMIFGFTRVWQLNDDPTGTQARLLTVASVVCVAALVGRWALRDER